MPLKQSFRGYVREHLERIELKITYGHPHELIRRELAKEGFDATLSSFRDALMHARKWKRKLGSSEAPSPIKQDATEVNDSAPQTNQGKREANSSGSKAHGETAVDDYFKRTPLFKRTKP
jgi:alanyl-tRNA synthetase